MPRMSTYVFSLDNCGCDSLACSVELYAAAESALLEKEIHVVLFTRETTLVLC